MAIIPVFPLAMSDCACLCVLSRCPWWQWWRQQGEWDPWQQCLAASWLSRSWVFWTVCHTSVVYLPQHGKESWDCTYVCVSSDNLVNNFALLMNLLSLMWALGFLLDLFHGITQCCPPTRNKSNENGSIFVTALKCLQKQKRRAQARMVCLLLVILLHATL